MPHSPVRVFLTHYSSSDKSDVFTRRYITPSISLLLIYRLIFPPAVCPAAPDLPNY